MSVSLALGVALSIVQYCFAPTAIALLSGKSVESIPFGIQYARIRAVAAPFALLTIASQSAFLAAKDSVSPLKAVIMGALVNLVGDIFFVTLYGHGVVGAAWATMLSQVTGSIYLVLAGLSASLRVRTAAGITTKRLSNPLQLLRHIRSQFVVPHWQDIFQFLSFCGPLFAVLCIKTLLWTFATYATSAAGAIDLAAHQVVINLFLFFCISGDVVAQIVQTYVPYTISPAGKAYDGVIDDSGGGGGVGQIGPAGHEIIQQMNRVALFVGAFNALVGLALTSFCGRFFTKSADIITKISSAGPLLALSAVFHSRVMVQESVLLVSKDLSFLSNSYFFSGALFLVYQVSLL